MDDGLHLHCNTHNVSANMFFRFFQVFHDGLRTLCRTSNWTFYSIYWGSKVVKLATLVESDPEALFSIATTLRCRGGCYSFLGLLHFTLDAYLIMLSAKQSGIKYHFLRVWYYSTWDWTQVSRTIGKHSIHSANGPVSTKVDGSNSVNHDQLQELSYCQYSLLFLPVFVIKLYCRVHGSVDKAFGWKVLLSEIVAFLYTCLCGNIHIYILDTYRRNDKDTG